MEIYSLFLICVGLTISGGFGRGRLIRVVRSFPIAYYCRPVEIIE